MKTVIITEKPSVAREYVSVLKVDSVGGKKGYAEGYSSVLNKEVIITWAVGHLVSICSPEEHNAVWDKKWSADKLPMIPSKFKYKPISKTYPQYKIVESIYKRKDIEAIYYAGDSGREGIYIQALIRNQIFPYPPSYLTEKVVWINSYTDEEIKRGLREAKPLSFYQNMINSGYARAISDWLIGMNFTESFTLACGGKLINTGRVMTPTLAMVVNRQKEIDGFVKTNFYGIKAKYNDKDISWKAVEGSKYYESKLLYNESGFLKKEDAEKLLLVLNNEKELRVDEVNVSRKQEFAPLLFNQTDLQNFCSKKFFMSPSETLSIAQSLYEKKLTTYPRTSARVLSSAEAKRLKEKNGFDIPAKYVNDDKIEDHFAIIPTFGGGSLDSLSETERKIYDVIYNRFMNILKPPFVYDAVKITYHHLLSGEYFFETFRNVVDKGYKTKLTEEEMKYHDVPRVRDSIAVERFEIKNLETKPPVPYTTGSLVADMEKAGKYIDDKEMRDVLKGKNGGIGTEATRASIVDKLIKKGFIDVDKKQKVSPTELGKAVIPFIAKYDEQLVSPIKTAELETSLNAIANGEKSYDEYITEIEKYVSDTTRNILSDMRGEVKAPVAEAVKSANVIGKCPKCGGDVISARYGFCCKNKCGMNVAKVFGKQLTETQLNTLLSGKSTSFVSKGRKTIVLPQVVENVYQGKTYYNWKTKK